MTGFTDSKDFPVTPGAFQQNSAAGGSAFITKLNPAGNALAYSTYLGGDEPATGADIAVEAAGKAYITGGIGAVRVAPSLNSEGARSGVDVFVIKIVSPPRIFTASVLGKRLIVAGKGFDKGAVIFVNGAEQQTKNDESNSATILIAKKAGKNIAPGQQVVIQVRNADGTLSQSFSFTRS